MARFALRHWTAILLALVAAGWALFYLPSTPSYSIFRLKQAIDNRNGDAAANYVDFQKVVRNAGYEMLQDDSSSGDSANSPISQFIGKGAVELFSGPMSTLLKRWAIEQVDSGAKEVQMPPVAVVGSIIMLHRYEDTAYTRWQDKKGQLWEVRMAREEGAWKVVEVKNVKELPNKLQRQEEKNLNSPPS